VQHSCLAFVSYFFVVVLGLIKILREMRYLIVKRNFIEDMFDLEFKDPALNGFFYKGTTR
jgi:hypothetical protein